METTFKNSDDLLCQKSGEHQHIVPVQILREIQKLNKKSTSIYDIPQSCKLAQ